MTNRFFRNGVFMGADVPDAFERAVLAVVSELDISGSEATKLEAALREWFGPLVKPETVRQATIAAAAKAYAQAPRGNDDVEQYVLLDVAYSLFGAEDGSEVQSANKLRIQLLQAFTDLMPALLAGGLVVVARGEVQVLPESGAALVDRFNGHCPNDVAQAIVNLASRVRAERGV